MADSKLSAIQAVRGMNDITPESSPYWQLLEDACRDLATAYCYREIRFPIVESTNLFKRTIGEVTDIVEKEMYMFDDRNGDSLTLRPEGTAGCVRACIQQSLLHQAVQRLWYLGPMFRHERPQKGRYRQFHQFGIEAFGMPGPDIDAEQILMCHRLWQTLNVSDSVHLEINTLGSQETRNRYRDELVAYFNKHSDQLDEDSQRRLTTNPLRILDSKNPAMQALLEDAPAMTDYLDEESQAHFEGLCRILDSAEVEYTVNPRLVRGLDYYDYTVYEWVTDALGAQGTVCAGGRYNALVEQLGGKPVPAVGFAMGLERMVLLLENEFECEFSADVYFVLMGEAAKAAGLVVAEYVRSACPWLRVEVNCTDGSFKSQFKRADKSGAKWAVVIGDEEVDSGELILKHLRDETEQETLAPEALIEFLQETMEE